MAKRRTTIGTNPLDAVIPTRRAEKPARPSRVVKERLTVHLPVDLIDRIKNAVYWTPGLTLAGLAEEALAAAVARLERERGEPFPPRKSELKGGRPLK
ncbi:MAG: hypothetical protein N3E42_02840 [Candidatus Bipolaricaulota bacterium]|nr:hypothetical protein [Candidatus Bipolaricaulota bacterium]